MLTSLLQVEGQGKKKGKRQDGDAEYVDSGPSNRSKGTKGGAEQLSSYKLEGSHGEGSKKKRASEGEGAMSTFEREEVGLATVGEDVGVTTSGEEKKKKKRKKKSAPALLATEDGVLDEEGRGFEEGPKGGDAVAEVEGKGEKKQKKRKKKVKGSEVVVAQDAPQVLDLFQACCALLVPLCDDGSRSRRSWIAPGTLLRQRKVNRSLRGPL